MTLFLIVLLAVLAANRIEANRVARRRHREYCHKESLRYTWMWRIDVLTGHDSELNKGQAVWWEKQSKSLVPTSPSQDEQDALLEQSQDDQIRQLIKDFNYWQQPESIRKLVRQ